MEINVNKSHAAAYAVVAYQTAYLMRYYTTEFIAAMLNSVMGSSEKVAFYIRFANERGIEILPPDINESYTKFTVQGEQIRFGIAAIKNVGVNVIENIAKVRSEKGKFKDLLDFCNKVDLGVINKRAVESLIKAGALDSFGVYRSRLLAVHEKVMDGINGDKKKNIQGQINLFSDFGDEQIDPIDIKYPEIREFDKKHLLFMEKEMTGLYLSGHPLEEHKEVLKNKTSINIGEIISSGTLEESSEGVLVQDKKVKDGQKVKIGGIITSVNKKLTKNNDMMAFVELEDLYGIIELVVFPKVFNKVRQLINEDAIILASGRVSIREDEAPKILCEDISELLVSSIEKVYIRIDTEEELQPSLRQLKIICPSYKGNVPIYLYVKSINKAFVMNKELWVNGEKELLTFLKNQFGIENIKVV
ncbi:OB-fold nucleic acid binding domain-containing protein [Clostridium sp. BSD9I1]|uniref:helix-hairpin-helix domain-containing protein n=1 Tax=Clostridium sp. BSD9I1 TaxID=2003589 RepID=UPI001FA89C11|nr:OB-fold nucleic acid binding domain-containing protein [Clostridium sp. BSD9I1]